YWASRLQSGLVRLGVASPHQTAESIGAAAGRPVTGYESPLLVRHGGFRVRRISRIFLDAANEIERGMEHLVVLRIWWNVGLRAGLLVSFGLEVPAQRCLAARIGARFELVGHLLKHLDVGGNALRLDRPSG